MHNCDKNQELKYLPTTNDFSIRSTYFIFHTTFNSNTKNKKNKKNSSNKLGHRSVKEKFHIETVKASCQLRGYLLYVCMSERSGYARICKYNKGVSIN